MMFLSTLENNIKDTYYEQNFLYYYLFAKEDLFIF